MIFDNNIVYQTCRILISIFCTLSMFFITSRLRENNKRNLLFIAGYAIYSIIITFLYIRFYGFLPFLRSAAFTISVPGVIITYLITDTTISKHIFCCLTHLTFSIYLIVGITLLNSVFKGSAMTNVFILLFSYIIVILFEYFFLRKSFLLFADTIKCGWWGLTPVPCAFFIFSMAIVVFPVHYTQNDSFILLFLLSVSVIIFVYYAIIQYMRLQYSYQMEDQNRELLKLQIENIMQQAKKAERKMEEIKNAKQDIHKMMSNIKVLAKEGNTKSIVNYIEKASAQNVNTSAVRYCNDTILNATLTSYFNRAKYVGITIEHSLSFPNTLPVDSAELSICFANALENAIHACEELPKDKRIIIIKCIHKPQLMFEIKNPYHGKISFRRNGLPNTLETNHGIGTRSIMAFCEKYNAFYSFSALDGWFKLVITL